VCSSSGLTGVKGSTVSPMCPISYESSTLPLDHWQFHMLLLSVPQMPLALSAKAFSISAPSVWNSLSYNCRSAEFLSTFTRNLKPNCLTLPTVNVNTQPSLCHYAPLICLWHMTQYINVFWLTDWLMTLLSPAIMDILYPSAYALAKFHVQHFLLLSNNYGDG